MVWLRGLLYAMLHTTNQMVNYRSPSILCKFMLGINSLWCYVTVENINCHSILMGKKLYSCPFTNIIRHIKVESFSFNSREQELEKGVEYLILNIYTICDSAAWAAQLTAAVWYSARSRHWPAPFSRVKIELCNSLWRALFVEQINNTKKSF